MSISNSLGFVLNVNNLVENSFDWAAPVQESSFFDHLPPQFGLGLSAAPWDAAGKSASLVL